MGISDAIEEYLGSKQNTITHSTYDWYAHYLHVFEQWCEENRLTDLSQITAPHVQQFASSAPTKNTNTRHARAQIVKGFLSWCSKDDEMGVKEKTVKRIEMPKVEQSEIILFTDAEIMKLFRACERMRHPHRNKAIVHILLDTGIRASELCFDWDRPEEETGLRMENLILGRRRHEESFIWVMGKGRKPRTIGLGQETKSAMKSYLNRERGRSESPFVFLSRDGEPLSVRMLQQFMGELGELAGVPNCHPHRFRHQFAVTQLLNGVSDLVLMQLMGHTTLESTKVYVRAMNQLQARTAGISVVDRLNKCHQKIGGGSRSR